MIPSFRQFLAGSLLVAVTASTAHAVDCDINVFQAYETAKARGWLFSCTFIVPGGKTTLMPFGDTIGCVIDTPPIVWPPSQQPTLSFFSDKTNKNGWSLKSYEITGAQWTDLGLPKTSRVFAKFKSLVPAKKYSVKVLRMTLTKNGGSCAKAIDEAF